MTTARFKCWIFGHDYYLIRRLGIASAHVGCRRCPKEWGMNHDARALLPWPDVAAFHAETHGYRP